MQILFASDRMHVPDDRSGSVQTTHTLAAGLARRGHNCHVLATLRGGTRYSLATLLYRLTGNRAILEWSDALNGYMTLRGSEWRFAERLERTLRRLQPDVLVLDAVRQLRTIASANLEISCPIVIYLHEIPAATALLHNSERLDVNIVANSPFTASQLPSESLWPVSVITPPVDPSSYFVHRPNARCATLIGLSERKGLSTAISMAKELRHIPFLFIESRPGSTRNWRTLRKRIEYLPNVTLRRATSDMRQVYKETKLLLIPSRVNETFGRVALEAQASGIPVLGRSVGALPWTIGAGGTVLPADAPDSAWSDALQALLNDDTQYRTASQAASENALRAEFRLDSILDQFETLLSKSAS